MYKKSSHSKQPPYSDSPGKFVARDWFVQDFQYLTGLQSIPDGRWYLSLCNRQPANKPGSEINQMVNSGFIKKSQFHGIDRDPKIIAANKRDHPEAHWYCDELHMVIEKNIALFKVKPMLIYCDFLGTVINRQNYSQLGGSVLAFCPADAIVVVTLMLETGWDRQKFLPEEIRRVEEFLYTPWQVRPEILKYKTNKVQMCEFIFYNPKVYPPKMTAKPFVHNQAHKLNVRLHAPKSTIIELGEYGRKFQIRYFKKSKGKRRTILVSPTGSGKSVMLIYAAARDHLESNYTRRQVILVPQLNIGKGFSTLNCKLKIDGKLVHWKVKGEYNFCNGVQDQEKIEAMKKFLLTPAKMMQKNLVQAIAVSCYQTAIQAFNELSPSEKEWVVENTSWYLDEGHHIMAGYTKANNKEIPPNELGDFVRGVMARDGALHLATATYFRTLGNVLGKDYEKEFFLFRVPFLEHWETLGIDLFQHEYISYKDHDNLLEKLVGTIRNEPDKPHLVILPSDGHTLFKDGDKTLFVSRLYSELNKFIKAEDIIDAINDQTVARKRINSDKIKARVMITCMIGREGFNWPECCHLHNLALDQAILQVIQKTGRLMRSSPGKTSIHYTNYVEHFDEWDHNVEGTRQKVSDRVNHVAQTMVIGDMFSPICVSIEGKNKSLSDLIGDDMVHELFQEMVNYAESRKFSPEKAAKLVVGEFGKEHGELLKDVPPGVIEELLVKHYVREAERPVLFSGNKKSNDFRQILPVEPILRNEGFDITEHHNSVFQSDWTGKRFEEVRKILEEHTKQRKLMEQHVQTIQEVSSRLQTGSGIPGTLGARCRKITKFLYLKSTDGIGAKALIDLMRRERVSSFFLKPKEQVMIEGNQKTNKVISAIRER